MYIVTREGMFDGYADSVIPIKLHQNGCYVPCEESEADGFCAKKAILQTDEDGNKYRALDDTVYRLEGHMLKGNEPVGAYEQHGAAVPLTEAEAALAELEAAYDAG